LPNSRSTTCCERWRHCRAAWMEISRCVPWSCFFFLWCWRWTQPYLPLSCRPAILQSSEHNDQCSPVCWGWKKEMSLLLSGMWWLLAQGKFCFLGSVTHLNCGRDPGRRPWMASVQPELSQRVCTNPLIVSFVLQIILTQLALCFLSI
jgi:hypothetical protein